MKMLNLTENNGKQKQLVVPNSFIVGSKGVEGGRRLGHALLSVKCLSFSCRFLQKIAK